MRSVSHDGVSNAVTVGVDFSTPNGEIEATKAMVSHPSASDADCPELPDSRELHPEESTPGPDGRERPSDRPPSSLAAGDSERGSFLVADRGVSKLVGVALTLAIVIALATTTAVLTIGLLETDEPVPQATFEFDYETGVSDPNCNGATCGVVRVHHFAGDTFDPEQVSIVVHYTDGGDRETFSATWADVRPNDVDAGDRVRVWTNDPIDGLSDARIELLWTSADGERSTVIDEWEGPEA